MKFIEKLQSVTGIEWLTLWCAVELMLVFPWYAGVVDRTSILAMSMVLAGLMIFVASIAIYAIVNLWSWVSKRPAR